MPCRPRSLYRLRYAIDSDDDDELYFENFDDLRSWLNDNADTIADAVADTARDGDGRFSLRVRRVLARDDVEVTRVDDDNE